jgi:hypothetical protein
MAFKAISNQQKQHWKKSKLASKIEARIRRAISIYSSSVESAWEN